MVTIVNAMAAYAPPGPVRTGPLAVLQGRWRSSFAFTPAVATAEVQPASTVTGQCGGTLLNDGYTLTLTYNDVVEDIPISGTVTISYDANSSRFVEHGSSNFGEISTAYGDYDEASKTLSFQGEIDNPETGGSETFVSEYVIKGNLAYDWNFYLVDANGAKILMKSASLTRM